MAFSQCVVFKYKSVFRASAQSAFRFIVFRSHENLFPESSPRRDTPKVLHSYVDAFAPNHDSGLSGSATSTRTLANSYHAGYQVQDPGPDGNYYVTHTPPSTYSMPTDTLGCSRQNWTPPAHLSTTCASWSMNHPRRCEPGRCKSGWFVRCAPVQHASAPNPDPDPHQSPIAVAPLTSHCAVTCSP